jgi:uridine phosphorylase
MTGGGNMQDDPTLLPDTDDEAMLPILAVRKSDLPGKALVVGDPARAEAAADLLDDPVEVGRNREYVTFAGRYGGTPVAVVSHGVGSAGAAVCFEELCRAGVKRIIRSGTAGGMQEYLGDGDVVVVSAAVRDEGSTERIVPLRYPAVANADVLFDLRNAAATRGQAVHEGIVLTSDLFYPHPVLGSDLLLWQRAGVVAVEMECAVLFVIAAQHGAAAGAILALDGNPLAEGDDDMAGYDPHRPVVREAVDAVLKIALDALILN